MDHDLVLVVEDETAIAELVALYLGRAGYTARIVGNGTEALELIRQLKPAAVVLDVGLPGLDGVEVCRRLRTEQNWTPILFVTARDDEVDRVVGLELGADDYVTKPFSPRELVARVGSVLRRTGRPTAAEPEHDVLVVGRVRLDLAARRVHVGEREVELTVTEFDLLAHLMQRPGRVYTREQLLTEVWGHHAVSGTRTVDVHVAQVRAKLGEASPLRTVRGVGYAAERQAAPKRAEHESADAQTANTPSDRDARAAALDAS